MNEPLSTPGPDLPAAQNAPVVIEAVVQTANTEIVYRRAGKGAQVLLLLADSGSEAVERTLLHVLSEDFRVIAPRLPPRANGAGLSADGTATVAISTWLRDLIDGLGLERPSIVADEAFGVAALGFALLDPERVDRLAVVRRSHAELALHRHGLDDILARSGHPLLLLSLGGPEQELPASARDALRRFLRTDRPRAAVVFHVNVDSAAPEASG